LRTVAQGEKRGPVGFELERLLTIAAPAEHGTNFEAPALTILVIRGDPRARRRIDVLDAEQSLHFAFRSEGGVAHRATFLRLLHTRGAAVAAAVVGLCDQDLVFADGSGGELSPVAALGLALMIYERVGAELCNRQETWALQHRGGFLLIDERVQREAGKIIAWKESFSCQVAVRVEVGGGRACARLQKPHLAICGNPAGSCVLARLGRQPRALCDFVCFLPLARRGIVERPPAIERQVEGFRRSLPALADEFGRVADVGRLKLRQG